MSVLYCFSKPTCRQITLSSIAIIISASSAVFYVLTTEHATDVEKFSTVASNAVMNLFFAYDALNYVANLFKANADHQTENAKTRYLKIFGLLLFAFGLSLGKPIIAWDLAKNENLANKFLYAVPTFASEFVFNLYAAQGLVDFVLTLKNNFFYAPYLWFLQHCGDREHVDAKKNNFKEYKSVLNEITKALSQLSTLSKDKLSALGTAINSKEILQQLLSEENNSETYFCLRMLGKSIVLAFQLLGAVAIVYSAIVSYGIATQQSLTRLDYGYASASFWGNFLSIGLYILNAKAAFMVFGEMGSFFGTLLSSGHLPNSANLSPLGFYATALRVVVSGVITSYSGAATKHLLDKNSAGSFAAPILFSFSPLAVYYLAAFFNFIFCSIALNKIQNACIRSESDKQFTRCNEVLSGTKKEIQLTSPQSSGLERCGLFSRVGLNIQSMLSGCSQRLLVTS